MNAMKKFALLLCACLALYGCNSDDDVQPEPCPEEELPDLSFPECLIDNDIVEYALIMDHPPSEPKAELYKLIYNNKEYFYFMLYNVPDFSYNYYSIDCEIFCRFDGMSGGNDCIEGFWTESEHIGVVWTDPR